eukprot:m51a1_g7713 hypothetical protein (401) ;mRNA; r:113379-114658
MASIDIELIGTHVFVAGEQRAVAGTVRFILASPLKAESIKAVLKGVMGGSWLSQGGNVAVHRDHVFLSRESEWLNVGHVIPAGETVVPFDLGTVGSGWPPSFEERTGLRRPCGAHVRYYVEVVVDTPFWRRSRRRYAPITVVSLGAPAELPCHDDMQPVVYHADLTSGCLFSGCGSGAVEMTLSLPRSVFCVGEVVAVAVHVRNGGCRAITDIEARVWQHTTCTPGHTACAATWDRELSRVATGCAVPPGKDFDVVVRLRAPPAATGFRWDHEGFRLEVLHVLEVALQFKGDGGRPLCRGLPVALTFVPRGADARVWSQRKVVELVAVTKPSIPWKVNDSRCAVLRAPHVQVLCVPVDTATAPPVTLTGTVICAREGKPLCSEPCFISADENPPPACCGL